MYSEQQRSFSNENSNGLFTTNSNVIFRDSSVYLHRNGASEVSWMLMKDLPLSHCWSGSILIENLPQRRLQTRLLPSEALGDLPGHSGISLPHTHGHMAPCPRVGAESRALTSQLLWLRCTSARGLGCLKILFSIFWTLPSNGTRLATSRARTPGCYHTISEQLVTVLEA